MRVWKRAALGALGLGIVGVVIVLTGIVPIKASSGHWPITEWFLKLARSRSVATYSSGVAVPDLNDPRLVLMGAGHYESGCRPCHGGPEAKTPRVAQGMTPPPPYLPPLLADYDREDLCYVIKHGVKFTGMPRWPSKERDDEVWAMVAFLEHFAEMDAEEYQALVYGELETGKEAAALEGLEEDAVALSLALERCARCHGRQGEGRGAGAFPKLAGQRARYLRESLRAYAEGRRHSGIMEPVAASLTGEEIAALSRYYASLPPGRVSAARSAAALRRELFEQGERIAADGIPGARVPSCADCHGPSDGIARNTSYPTLSGQHEAYLVLQLYLFKAGLRGGGPYAHLMSEVAPYLTEEQIRAVSAYYANRRPEAD